MVEVSVEGEVAGIDLPMLIAQAEKLLGLLGLSDAELSLLVCDDAYISDLNAQWRGKDAPTDVLSFPQQETTSPGQLPQLETGILESGMVLGDVVISAQTAARQATSLGHSLEVELVALLVHGTLHLLGHDHEDRIDPGPMRTEEVRLLLALGLDGAAALVGRAS